MGDEQTVRELEEERDRLRDQLAKAEALRDEWEGTFRIWRQRCAEARAERDRLREIAHAGELLVAALDAGTVHNEWSELREKLMAFRTREEAADG